MISSQPLRAHVVPRVRSRATRACPRGFMVSAAPDCHEPPCVPARQTVIESTSKIPPPTVDRSHTRSFPLRPPCSRPIALFLPPPLQPSFPLCISISLALLPTSGGVGGRVECHLAPCPVACGYSRLIYSCGEREGGVSGMKLVDGWV